MAEQEQLEMIITTEVCEAIYFVMNINDRGDWLETSKQTAESMVELGAYKMRILYTKPQTVSTSVLRLNEKELRAEFIKQHKGRDLTQHRLRGTYVKAQIAALWNQHVRTVLWIKEQLEMKEE